MLPFLATFMDFDSSEETYERYDKMSAYELFKLCGVSKVCAWLLASPLEAWIHPAVPVAVASSGLLSTGYDSSQTKLLNADRSIPGCL